MLTAASQVAPDATAPARSIAIALEQLSATDLLALHAFNPTRYPVLLESAAVSAGADNYDILLAFPGEQLVLQDACLQVPASLPNAATQFLPMLDHWWRQTGSLAVEHELPFQGGWFIYLSYELAAQIEPGLHLPMTGLIAKAVRIPAAIVRRCSDGSAWLVAESDFSCLALARADLASARTQVAAAAVGIDMLSEEPEPQFLDAVQKALLHIAAGDIYQANLSRGWHAMLRTHEPVGLYQALRRANPAPFAGLAQLGGQHVLLSSSPERLLKIRNGWASTRPIAGTRPRAATTAIDQALRQELYRHPKERAEHIMLIDLERNDLGKICVGGTVQVDEYMSVESYAHVHHIVSNVRGQLRADVSPGMAIAAVFPGGTITGCPKLRCMQIIAALEIGARGAYTGSMGYLNRDGSMDLNILIRTLELNGRTLHFRAGAGIVADSIAEQELLETRAKAQGLLRALQN